MAAQTDSELGRSLMAERGMQWLYAHGGDPYARLLRAEGDDRDALAARIRQIGPLYRSRTGAWVTGDYVLGAKVLDDPRLSFRAPDGLPEGHVLRQCDVFPYLPVAEHDRLRARAELSPRASAAECLCDEALGRIGGELDLVTDVLRPVLVALVGDLLAVPPAERVAFGWWCHSAAIALDATLCPPRLAPARALINAVNDLRALLGGLAGQDRSRLAAGMLACVVGVEVTVNVVANALLALLDELDRWRLLCADPGLADGAVEEILRYDPPVRLDSRVAREDLELAGQPISAGEEVVVHIEAANRDPGSHQNPDRFDLFQTSAADHLSLSGGPHLGLLAPLVRTSASALLRALAARVPQVRRRGSVVRRLRAPVTHAIVRFPVAT